MFLTALYDRLLAGWVRRRFFLDLVRRTDNFHGVHWMGDQVWQNVLDLWTTADTISEVRPALLIETGGYPRAAQRSSTAGSLTSLGSAV